MTSADHQSLLTQWSGGDRFEYRGFDLVALGQFFLWDKIARAVRLVEYPAAAEFEIDRLRRLPLPNLPSQTPPRADDDGRARVLLPASNPRFASLWEHLRLVPDMQLQELRRPWAPHGAACTTTGLEVAASLSAAAQQAMSHAGFPLHPIDVDDLGVQLERLTMNIDAADWAINEFAPDVVMTHVDTNPPMLPYIRAAQAVGIPTVTFQHGLDCEDTVLNDAHADHFVAWSQWRIDRFRRSSAHQPTFHLMAPLDWQEPSPAAEPCPDGPIVLVTRPHSPRKLYDVRRFASEGAEILAAVLDAAALADRSVVVKAHPADDIALLTAALEDSPVAAHLADGPLDSVIASASIVISEDSTAVVDAIAANKPLVFAHFSETPPTIPAVEMGAALAARASVELHESVRMAIDMLGVPNDEMRRAQGDLLRLLIGHGEHAQPALAGMEQLLRQLADR